MPEVNHFDSLLFEEAKEKCAFYGVKFSKLEFMKDPEKYCDFIDKYTAELKDFIENNNQKFIELQGLLANNDGIPKYMVLGKARLEMEKEFQQHLLSNLNPIEIATTQNNQVEEKIKKQTELEQQEQEARLEEERRQQERLREIRRLRREERIARRNRAIQAIKNNIQNYRASKKQEKTERIARRKEFIRKQTSKFDDFSFENIKKKSIRTLKHLAVAVPFIGATYMTYLGIKNPGKISDNSNSKATTSVVVNPPQTRESKSKTRTLNFNIETKRRNRVASDEATVPQTATSGLPEHQYKSINANIPVLSDDKLLQLPNIDLFNYCFDMSNDYFGQYNKYGINRKIYNDFMGHNLSTARMNRISDYNNLSYTDLRIIAKAEIFDAYGIGYMQNQSIASYMYNVLLKQYTGKNFVGAVAQGVKDFYNDEKKEIHPSQLLSIDRLIDNPYINMRDWKQLVTLINKTSVNPEYESKLFSYIKDRVEHSGLADANNLENENKRFTYEPTIKEVKIGKSTDKDSFLPKTTNHNFSKISSVYSMQKDRDLEIFFNIYKQCSHQNYVNLKFGNNRKYYFSEANRALRNFGVQSSLHPSLYCAGMSMASLCQAATIFKEENPNSYLNSAISDFINSCNNVHSCTTLKNDLSLISSSVHRSYNLESDVKNYMNANDNAILFVWSPRSSSRYHHQTLFPSALTNHNDAYTYCAFNNQHWGNENTFARYMRSRSQYGKGGYFADIKSVLDRFTERHMDRALNNALLTSTNNPIHRYSYHHNILS